MTTPGTSDLAPGAAKVAARALIRERRRAYSHADRELTARAVARVGLELPAIRAAGCVALYAALPDEPGTAQLRAALRARGVRLLLPVIADATTLDWADDEGELSPGAGLGVPEPAGGRSLGPAGLAAADVVLVPAFAVDTAGTRLGRGRGYYDRALAFARPAAPLIAVVHDDELFDARTSPLPREEHDIAIVGAVTPSRWLLLTETSS